MKNALLALALLVPAAAYAKDPTSLYKMDAVSLEGEKVKLSKFKGKVALVVNTASKCGYTGQYKGLQSLYDKYKDKGFVVLGFPSNDFRSQEPGSNSEIAKFCQANYGVTFPMFEKNPVKGDATQPVYKFLKASPVSNGEEIGWNFTKFLVDKKGQVVARFPSSVKPESEELVKALESQL